MFARFIIITFLFTASVFTQAWGQSSEARPQGPIPYRLAGFQFPAHPKAKFYRLEIASGHWTARDSFEKYRLKDTILATNRSREVLPRFGQDYTWTYTALGKRNTVLSRGPWIHTQTMYHPIIDTSLQRLEVRTPDTIHQDLYVFADEIGVLYDQQGSPLWFLPPWPEESKLGNRSLRDLKPTHRGSLTGLNTQGAYEISYEGEVLWKAPTLDSSEGVHKNRYHHQMDLLPNGHYMVLGEERVWIRLEDTTGTWESYTPSPAQEIEKRADGLYKRFLCGTVIEYDPQGVPVWTWSSADYFREQVHVFNPELQNPIPAAKAHLNGFFFDETHGSIYLSFRDLSRILQIAYPSQTLIRSLGAQPQVQKTRGDRFRVRSAPALENTPFLAQHHPQVSPSGILSLFNNRNHLGDGGPRMPPPSEITLFQIPKASNQALHTLWTFSCDIDSLAPAFTRRGGSVYTLPDQSLLVCMGNAGRIFIVDGEKQIQWNAIPFRRSSPDEPWRITPLYRTSFLYGASAIDALIFSPPSTDKKP